MCRWRIADAIGQSGKRFWNGRRAMTRAPAPRRLHPLRRFVGDERGAISILGAFFILLGLSLSVVVIDIGHLYLQKRRLQAAVDAAALAASGDPANAASIVQADLARNGYQNDHLTIETGTYRADPSLGVEERLDTASGQPPNAVRVIKAVTVADIFARLFSGDGPATITATATAARIPTVSFSVGSGLASLSGGNINQVLGRLLGADLTLSLADYTALASTHVDALGFLDQLAFQAGVTAGTYGDLANTTVSMGQIIAAGQAAMNIQSEGQDGAALDALNLLSLQVPQGVSTKLGALVDTSLWQSRRIGSVVQQDPGAAAINLFDMVSAMARIYGAGHLADLGTGLSVPVANSSVSTYLSAGQPMASMTTATVGMGLSTSQVRLALTVTVANVDLGVAKATIRLPVYVQMATGQATVTAIPCHAGGTMATITAEPTAVSAQIGSVDTGLLSNYGATPTPQQAVVVSLTILGVPVGIVANASDAIGAGPATPLDFSQSDIDAGTVKSAGADTSHLLSGLADKLSLSVQGSGVTGVVSSIVSSTVMPLVRPVLQSVLTSLDPVVGNLLQAAGIRLGLVSVAVHGVSCGRPTIVE